MVLYEVNARGMNPNAPFQKLLKMLGFIRMYIELHVIRVWEFLSVNTWDYAKGIWKHYTKDVPQFYKDNPKYLEGEEEKSVGQKVADFVLLLLTPITWILGLCWKLLVGIKNAIFGGGGHHGH